MAHEHQPAGATHVDREAPEKSVGNALGATQAGIKRGDAIGRFQGNLTSEITAVRSDIPIQRPPQRPQPCNPGVESTFSAHGYPSAFNLGPVGTALPQQSPNAGHGQWVPGPAQQLRHPMGGVPQQRPSDHMFIPHQQYHPYYSRHGAPQSANQFYMSPHDVQYQGQYIPVSASNPQMLPQQPDPYYYSPAKHFHQHGQTYHAYGQGQPYVYYTTGVPNRPAMEQLPLYISPSATNSTSKHTSDISTASQPLSQQSARSLPRGPPRKPRQSGHALWVGNLPPGITVVDLKDRFAREATRDIESVKLISKSNCAFVNYRTHLACAAAMERFHDSRFHGTKLVCRLRRTTPASPSAGPTDASAEPSPIGEKAEGKKAEDGVRYKALPGAVDGPPPSVEGLPERFFVLKSLTLEDLEASTQTGVWATQSHNEEVLNRAYGASENVYLFFSANKSGEYFGFARMASRIGEITVPTELGLPSLPSPGGLSIEDPLISIRTGATEWAPKGRIIDDVARGTIFWEADSEDEDEGTERNEKIEREEEAAEEAAEEAEEELDNNGEENDKLKEGSQPVSPTMQDDDVRSLRPDSVIASNTPVPSATGYSRCNTELNTSERSPGSSPGKAFQITWISLKKLPFYKCRGLRNPWNASREVKIARDGTELETSVGKKLMSFFPQSGYHGTRTAYTAGAQARRC